jgi:hypothetical protein
MDRARDQFLPCPGFALDEDSGFGGRYAHNLCQHCFERWAAPDNLLEAAPI